MGPGNEDFEGRLSTILIKKLVFGANFKPWEFIDSEEAPSHFYLQRRRHAPPSPATLEKVTCLLMILLSRNQLKRNRNREELRLASARFKAAASCSS